LFKVLQIFEIPYAESAKLDEGIHLKHTASFILIDKVTDVMHNMLLICKYTDMPREQM
jgi:hypothetical protein